MPTYAIHGECLETDLAIPELSEQQGCGRSWRFEVRHDPAPWLDGIPTGTDTVYGTCCVRALRAPEGYRLVFDDTGTFDVDQTARTIRWHRAVEASDAAARADLLGRVMAVAAHAAGRLALHASAVSVGGRAIALLGPKGIGKSTLALALVRRGGCLLTDDTLIVDPTGPDGPVAAPGVQRLRLWDDAARALGAPPARGDLGIGPKPTLDILLPDQRETRPVPLAACHVLVPALPDGADARVGCEPITGAAAVLALVQHAKLAPLLGGPEAAAVLDRAALVARHADVSLLVVPRDLGRIDRVARQVVDLHAGAGVRPPAPPASRAGRQTDPGRSGRERPRRASSE